MRFCKCGCNEQIEDRDSRGRERFFKRGHTFRSVQHPTGKNHWNWQGGRILRGTYVQIYSPKHPFCDHYGYVMEHRLIMEGYLNRYLEPSEEIHHKNGVTYDNRIENLQLFSNHSNHMRGHRRVHHDQSCIYCNSDHIWKKFIRNNKRVWQCQDCRKHFSLPTV